MSILKMLLGSLFNSLFSAVNEYIAETKKERSLKREAALGLSNKQLKESLDEVVRVRDIRNRLANDAAFRDSVRDRFRRDDS